MRGSGKVILAGVAILVGLGAGLALYGTRSGGGNSAPGPANACAPASETVRRVAPRARGEVAAFQAEATPRPAPALTFKGPDGADVTLADLGGRTLLVNLWATWCAPCKAEMPALDRLQADLGDEDFAVVAINVDTRNVDKPPTWLKDNGIGTLAYYSDPAGRVLPAIQQGTGSTGLPTTILVDPQGCQIGVVKGPADWASEDAKRLIRAATGRP